MFAVLALDIEPFPLSHCRAPNLFQQRCARWAGAVCVFIVGVQHIAMAEFSFPASNGSLIIVFAHCNPGRIACTRYPTFFS